MKSKYITPGNTFVIAAALLISLIIGCGTLHPRVAGKQIIPKHITETPYQVITVHDTIRQRMTEKELQAYLAPIYKYNYETYFLPQFMKLTAANDRLSAGNDKLSQALNIMILNEQHTFSSSTRLRSKFDSLKTDDDYFRKQYIKNLAQQAETQRKNHAQDLKDAQEQLSLTKIGIVLPLAAIICIMIFLAFLTAYVRKINKDVQKLKADFEDDKLKKYLPNE